MPRKKEYIEEEVIEKAMGLFWRNGYETTSMRMLEKEMGINQFSINSSFGNKQSVFIHSIKCYSSKVEIIIDKLEASTNGIEGIKTYFYDFLAFTKERQQMKGCLINNTLNEFGADIDPAIRAETKPVVIRLSNIFREKLSTTKDAATVKRQVNYLLICLQGLTAGSKVFKQSQVIDFIETTFEGL